MDRKSMSRGTRLSTAHTFSLLLCLQSILLHKKLSNKQSGSVIFRLMVKLSATHAFNWIVLMVKFGLTSYEELPPALWMGYHTPRPVIPMKFSSSWIYYCTLVSAKFTIYKISHKSLISTYMWTWLSIYPPLKLTGAMLSFILL